MLKLEIGKTYPARCRPNNAGTRQTSYFTIIGIDGPLFLGRGKLPGNDADHYRAFTETGASANGGAWELFENPPKPREFYAVVLKDEVNRGKSCHSGWIYSNRPENGDGASGWSEVIKVAEILPE